MAIKEMGMQIPSFDLTRQNIELRKELMQVISGIVEKGHFILGKNVMEFEKEIAELCGAEFGIGVANCSEALYLTLLACGIGSGDEVITTPFTFIASASAIVRVGARPVFCDIDPFTYNIDVQKIEALITRRTKAILPVHLYGQPADMNAILMTAKKYNLYVIEDAAQALGANYKKKPVGSFGDVACISFFPTKNLGAFGDGGMVVTSNPKIAEQVRILRVHGGKNKYYHEVLGCNSRLDELQAGILKVKLNHLPAWTAKRRLIASRYIELLEKIPNVQSRLLRLPQESAGVMHVYHQFTIATPERDRLKEYLKANGIESAIYYPLPLHLQEVFHDLGYKEGDFPEAERVSKEVLSLPMFPELTDEEVIWVVKHLKEFCEGKA